MCIFSQVMEATTVLKENMTGLAEIAEEPNVRWWKNSLQVLARPCSVVPERYSMQLMMDIMSVVQRYRDCQYSDPAAVANLLASSRPAFSPPQPPPQPAPQPPPQPLAQPPPQPPAYQFATPQPQSPQAPVTGQVNISPHQFAAFQAFMRSPAAAGAQAAAPFPGYPVSPAQATSFTGLIPPASPVPSFSGLVATSSPAPSLSHISFDVDMLASQPATPATPATPRTSDALLDTPQKILP